jgi:diguanylate cyclase (GGDEF)-like protein
MSETPPHRYLPRKMSRLLMAGFAMLIGLMVLLTFSAVRHMQSQEDRMRDIVELRNRKIQLATDLLHATHNRHNSLVYQVLVDDPFERDEHFQHYIKWGYEVGKARNALRAMSLNTFEVENLRRQDELVQTIVGIQEAVSDLASRGRVEEARQMIAVTLRPYNLNFIHIVEDLQIHERAETQRSLVEARLATRQAVLIDTTLGVLLTILAGLIAVFTYRQLRRYAGTIHEQMLALEETGEQLQHEATHDTLTGLPNRSLFYHRLQEALSHAGQEGLKATVLYIDLDNFKPVNDQYGHAAGDCLLQAVAERLLASVRATDTVARLGGDEFALILLGMGEEGQIAAVRREIDNNVGVPLHLGETVLTPGCSIGQAVFPEDGATMDALLHIADARMYEFKRANKTVA